MVNLKKTKWIPTDKRFVAFFDILGFKDLVMRTEHKIIYELLSRISELRNQINNIDMDSSFANAEMYNTEMYTVSFSDSIILFSKSDSLQDFKLFSYSTAWLFSNAISLGIPLKCGIAHGEISVNKSNNIFFGQPIIDAYLIEEEVNYFGIVAHNSVEKYYYENIDSDVDLKNVYKDISTPLKCGTISHLNLDYFRLISGEEKKEKNVYLTNLINQFKTTVSGSPRRYIDNTIKVINDIYPIKT